MQNQHIYCMINGSLQKICKNKLSGLENIDARLLFLKSCVKNHLVLQLLNINT